jgi:hypothetical protein
MRLKENQQKNTFTFNKGSNLKNVPFFVPNKISSSFDLVFLFSQASPQLLHKFSLFLHVQLLYYLKPCALNAEFQHFIPIFNKTYLLCEPHSKRRDGVKKGPKIG